MPSWYSNFCTISDPQLTKKNSVTEGLMGVAIPMEKLSLSQSYVDDQVGRRSTSRETAIRVFRGRM